MTTMVALVGEQPQPNYLPVLHARPENVVFVYTERTRQQYTYLKIMLEKQGINVDGIETAPYDISTITMTLEKNLTSITTLAPQTLVFNLTGGTKPMLLAAYQIAERLNAPVMYLQSERGRSTIDYYNWQDHQLCYQRQEQLTQHLSLNDILHLHLGPEKDAKARIYGK